MKRVLITGASDGLGKAIALKCLENGISVVNISRSKLQVGGVDNIPCDLSKEKDMEKACHIIGEKYREFDALINCAGTQCIEPTNKTPYDKLENVIKVNTIAPMFLICRLFDLIKENGADIVNIGSTVGLKSGPLNQVGYTTSKWALRGTSLNIGAELKNSKCRVIQFNAGGMNTDFIKKYNGETIKDPNEWIDPEDMADVVLFTLQVPKNIEISEIAVNRKRKQ